MNEYQHSEVSVGFTLTGENRFVRIPGKRKWYAPWLRHPDRLVDIADATAARIQQARNSI